MIEIRGRCVTFIPPKGAAYLIGDFTDWDEKPLPIAEPLTLEFPQGAYIEYAFLDADQRPITDSANPQTPENPWYDYHRSITLPQNTFTTPPQSQPLYGRISEHILASRVFAAQREYYVYEPSSFPVATVYVHDGEGFYHKLRFHEIADSLIEQKVIQPIRLVMMEPHDRVAEYWFNEQYETFLLQEIFPEVEHHYGVTAKQGLWGASLGGLVSVWLAWRNPDIFSYVASQSGCFTAHPEGGDEYHDAEWLTEQVAQTARQPLRYYAQTGQIEWLLAPNRRFAAILADHNYPHCYQELPSGHNWATWKQGLEPGLKYLFGTDLLRSETDRLLHTTQQEITKALR